MKLTRVIFSSLVLFFLNNVLKAQQEFHYFGKLPLELQSQIVLYSLSESDKKNFHAVSLSSKLMNDIAYKKIKRDKQLFKVFYNFYFYQADVLSCEILFMTTYKLEKNLQKRNLDEKYVNKFNQIMEKMIFYNTNAKLKDIYMSRDYSFASGYFTKQILNTREIVLGKEEPSFISSFFAKVGLKIKNSQEKKVDKLLTISKNATNIVRPVYLKKNLEYYKSISAYKKIKYFIPQEQKCLFYNNLLWKQPKLLAQNILTKNIYHQDNHLSNFIDVD